MARQKLNVASKTREIQRTGAAVEIKVKVELVYFYT